MDRQVMGRPSDGKHRVRFVLPYESDFLLQEAQSPEWAGWIRAAGGTIEEGETAKQTVVRECQEEFSFTPAEEDIVFLGRDPTTDAGEYYFFLIKNHPLTPGTYITNDNPPQLISLVVTTPDNPNYLGYDFRIWLG